MTEGNNENFPVEVKGQNIIIDLKKMKENNIYCFEFQGRNYQVEKDRFGVVVMLEEVEVPE